MLAKRRIMEFIYKPPETQNTVQESKFYIKFSKNITLLESFLIQNKIQYEQEELEDTALGRGVIIRID